MAKRKIIKIDEDKCNGCGLCIPACREGALRIVDGKARLASDVLCDGLGACLGHCPQDAITIEDREAEEFDEKEVVKNRAHHSHMGGSCPGSRMMDLGKKKKSAPGGARPGNRAESELRQWPVQIALLSPSAPYFKDADILIAADCVPFAYANFHEDLLKGKVLLVGCPKLDDLLYYKEKITEILKINDIRSITYAHMEVPCCFGLVGVIKEAISGSGKTISFKEAVISIEGERIR